MKLLTIPELAEGYAHMSDEAREQLIFAISGTSSLFVSQWAWRRTIRKVGPVLLRLRNGEKLSASDSRLLLTSFTLTVYLASRNAYSGWLASRKLLEVADSLAKRQVTNQ